MIGESVFELDYVDSTNAYAERLLQLGPVESGRVIWAREQYAGRGQHDHTWLTEPGKNLTCSVILHPSFLAPDMQFLLNKAVSLAVVDVVNSILDTVDPSRSQQKNSPLSSAIRHPVTIKWPNDIYIGDRKTGGILIANKIMGNDIETTVAGIGLNINQQVFPTDIPNAGSLFHFLGHETDVREVLSALCNRLDQRYAAICGDDTPARIDAEYDELLLGYGQWRPFTSVIGPLEGMILGVNSLGQLRLETRQGELMVFNHGEVEYVF